jgi:RNA 3'-terminal phosphate cyclase
MNQGIYGQFNAGYGEEVAVRHSSGSGVWLSITQRVTEADKEKRGLNGELCLKVGEAAAHLTPAQAVVLRAALDNYLAEQEEE